MQPPDGGGMGAARRPALVDSAQSATDMPELRLHKETTQEKVSQSGIRRQTRPVSSAARYCCTAVWCTAPRGCKTKRSLPHATGFIHPVPCFRPRYGGSMITKMKQASKQQVRTSRPPPSSPAPPSTARNRAQKPVPRRQQQRRHRQRFARPTPVPSSDRGGDAGRG